VLGNSSGESIAVRGGIVKTNIVSRYPELSAKG